MSVTPKPKTSQGDLHCEGTQSMVVKADSSQTAALQTLDGGATWFVVPRSAVNFGPVVRINVDALASPRGIVRVDLNGGL